MLEGGDNPFGGEVTCPDYPVLEIAAPNTDTFVRLYLSGLLSGSAGDRQDVRWAVQVPCFEPATV